MMRISYLFFISIVSINLSIAQHKKQRSPNFIFILTDDHRYDQLGCTGNDLIQTPNLDQLARDGILFNSAYVTSAICTPSRISILLSQFERKHGVNFNSGTSVSEEAWEQSYPVVMRKKGYYTGYIGKNHAPIGEGGYSSGLMERSFDYWYASHGHLRFYPKDKHKIFRGAKRHTQVEILDEGITDFLSNAYSLEGAKHFLENRPLNQPFCLSIALNVPHGSSTGSMEMRTTDSLIYRTLYRNIEIPLPEYYLKPEDVITPKIPKAIHFASERQSGYNYVADEQLLKERIIRSMQTITGVDGLVGNLRAVLKKNKLHENTIIVFTSDHGLLWGEFGLGGKALCYELCTHVPMIIYNPMAPAKARGVVSEALVQTIDIAPTLLDFAGIEIPEAFQGKSIRSIIEGDDHLIREYLYTENLWSTQFGNPRCEAVQNKAWKYIRYYKNENLKASAKIEVAKEMGIPLSEMLYAQHDPDIALYRTFVEGPLNGEPAVYEELYHLSKDPGETINLAGSGKHQKELDKMRAIWELKIREARGLGAPSVLRYTKDSQLEKHKSVTHE